VQGTPCATRQLGPRSTEIQIQISDFGNFIAIFLEMLCCHDGNSVHISECGISLQFSEQLAVTTRRSKMLDDSFMTQKSTITLSQCVQFHVGNPASRLGIVATQ
jgi:hypothetical protein